MRTIVLLCCASSLFATLAALNPAWADDPELDQGRSGGETVSAPRMDNPAFGRSTAQYSVQMGDNNWSQATSSATGSQDGNQVIQKQYGNGNVADAQQLGASNTLTQVQVGNDHQMSAQQLGNGNTLTEQQLGGKTLGVKVTQTGGAKAVVTQRR